MFAFLLTLLIIDALVLSVVVLLQAGQGGGLASLGGAGGTDTVLGGRQAVTILTKASWWCGGIFMVLSLILQFVPRGGGSSDLQDRLRATSPAVPAPSAPLPLGGSSTTTTPPADAKTPAAKSPAPPAPSSGAPAPEKKKP
ncbi:MAG TPA: preprotein translocase subunit SecG [Gemmatimonadales bacterium]|jgi:preprotein translocase subunit SecG